MSKKSKHIITAIAVPLFLLGANVLLLHTDAALGYGRETLFLNACIILSPVVLVGFGVYVCVTKRKELIPALAVFSGSSVVSLLLQVHYVWGWWCPFIAVAD